MYRRRTLTGLEACPPRRKYTPRQQTQLDDLWAMTPEERVTAMREGRLTLFQLCRWSSRYPEQVPLLGGEFEWIVVTTPEWLEDSNDGLPA